MRLSEQLELLEQQSSDSSRKAINQNQMQKQQLIKLLQEIIIRLLEFSVTERKSNMCSDVKITQKVLPGAGGNTVVANQNNYGLTVTEATQMAFQIFREYYPQLKKEAIAELQKMLTEELEKVSPQNIIPPTPRIAVPTLQGASISDEEMIRRLYAKLLAGTMNTEKREYVHPAFVRMIDEMNEMDAKVLKAITDINDSIPVARVTFNFEGKYLTHAMPHFYSMRFDGLGNKYDISRSIENLSRLNLINLFEGSVNGFDYKKFETTPYIKDRFDYAVKNHPEWQLTIKISEYTIQENDIGHQFANVCILD